MKRKQTKGKRLNIFGEELARPLLISPTRLGHLKEELTAKEATKEKEEKEKEQRKIQAKENRKQKEAEKLAKMIQNQVNQQLRQEKKRFKEDQKAARKAEREEDRIQKARAKEVAKNQRVRQRGGRVNKKSVSSAVNNISTKTVTTNQRAEKVNQLAQELSLLSFSQAQNNDIANKPSLLITLRFRNRRKVSRLRRLLLN